MKRLVAAIVFIFCCAPSALAAEESGGPRARLTMKYLSVTDGSPNPEMQPFLYPEAGFSFVNEYLWVDFNTPLPVVILDGITLLFTFAATESTELPIMSGLNDSDEAGWISIIELSGGPVVADILAGHLGVGVFFEYVWSGPTFEGERVNIQVIDVAPMVHMYWPGDGADLTLGLSLGNGFHRFSNFNPFVQLHSSLEVQVWGALWLAFSGKAQFRQISFESYEPPYFSAPEPSAIRGSDTHLIWSLEFGPSLHF